MTLIVVGLLCLLLGVIAGIWIGIELADAFLKPIYKQGDNAVTACTCRQPRKTEEMK